MFFIDVNLSMMICDLKYFSRDLFHGYERYTFLLRGSYLKQLYYVIKPIVNRTCMIMVLLLTGF